MLTQEKLNQLFEYKDGNLYWKEDRHRAKLKGNKAGCIKDNRYFVTRVDGKLYYNHRLIFMMHYGYMPDYIDHVDGDGFNNKIENLRECTAQQNQFNRKFIKPETLVKSRVSKILLKKLALEG